jgi:U3 small nucleolar RNA-associated protein 10
MLGFWAGVITEATNGMLDKARSGRRGVQQQNEHDVILRLLPVLNEGLAMKKVEGLRLGCYMILSVLASKGGLDDKLLMAMMEAVVLGWTSDCTTPGLFCLSVLAHHRNTIQLPKRLTKELLKIEDLPSRLVEISKQGRVDKLATSFCLALVDRLKKNGDVNGLRVLVGVVENQLLSDAQIVVVFDDLLAAAQRIDDKTVTEQHVRSQLAASLVTLTQLPGNVGFVIQRTMKNTEVDIDELEMNLHTTFRRKELPAPTSELVTMEDASNSTQDAVPCFSKRLEQLPKRITTESSFLSHNPSHIYSDLCEAFLASVANNTDIKTFDEIPILRRSSALEDSLYLSFYMRTWCGRQYPVMARASALQMATKYFSGNKSSNVDVQAMIPYVIVALGDPATKVRSVATKLLIAMEQFYPHNVESKKSAKQFRAWASDDIYGRGIESQGVKWLSIDVVLRLLRDLLIPAIGECVLDEKHIEAVLQNSLNGPRSSETPKKPESGRLSQAARISIFAFLASHAVHTPLLLAKLRLLTSLNQIRSVANTSRTKFLLPVLQKWASCSPSEAHRQCEEEHVELSDVDDQAVATVTANDKDGLQFLNTIISGEVATDRGPLIAAVFRRLRAMWASLKGELQLQVAQTLMVSSQVSHDEPNHHEAASEASAELLRTTPLSTDILLSFLAQLPTAAKLADKPPATKRRRTSHGEVARTPLQDSKQLTAAIKKVTFVLQLIDSSDPGSHPDLLKELFNILAELQHFKAQVASELAYLQVLVLGSLLAITQSYKSHLKLDRSAVRVDLLVDCVQKTASPQVQNAALLLIASLAGTAPELVLHSVMPIFTFMGSSVLRQNDEYSAHVINQTIREVIPPLISSLRKEKGNPVTGAAELLLSFVAAYEHIPSHRRRGLFTSLVQTLGAEDFLFALLAMLVDKYGITENTQSFAIELSNSFSVEVQLQSAVKYLELVRDVLKPKPTYSTVLLTASDEGTSDPHHIALHELTLLPYLLSQKRLISQTAKLLDRDDMDAARIRDLYSTLLENLLALADTLKDHKKLHSACGDVLESLLGLLSTSEFVKSVEGLLDRPNEALRRKILRSFEVRIDQESPADAISRTAMLGFLPQLTAIIRESTDVQYKRIAVNCVDKISAKYGKKDLEAVSAAAETISSKHCLGHSDGGLRILALLCLASLVEILREGVVSVLPIAIPKALEYIESSISDDTDAQRLHNAGYAFISSLVHHLPYMISGGYLDKLLSISNDSAKADLDDEADESRVQCLQLAAKQLDAKSMFTALEKNWEKAASAGTIVRIPDQL